MRQTLLFLLLAVLSACAATRGYPGPERSDSETAWLYFRAREGVSLSELKVGEYQQGYFDWGIRILPGNQKVSFVSSVPEEHCYIGHDNQCPVITRTFFCEIVFDAEAEQTYIAEGLGYGSDAGAWIIRESDAHLISTGSCKPQSWW